MADEDSGIDLGEDSETAAAPAKKGGLGGILPTILKYVALALGAIVLIVTVVIITMNVMGGNKTRQTQVPIIKKLRQTKKSFPCFVYIKFCTALFKKSIRCKTDYDSAFIACNSYSV